MPQRLEITNFGPLKKVSIEIRPLLLLIGQQASGKSTIAKLIYFFQSLSAEFFSRFYQSPREGVDITKDLIIPIREKFYDFFGSTYHLPEFQIIYYYDDERSLTLTLTSKKRINALFSESFFSKSDFNELRGYKKMLIQLKNGETFENMLQQSIQKNIEEQGHRAFEAKEQTIDETLMLSFMQRVIKMRQLFINLGNFEGMISHSNARLKPKLQLANKLIRSVLHGQYSNSEFGERIVHPGSGYVYLKNASSGQQESIRILQDAFLSIYQGNKLLRIVEEPEAHLFPEAQMATIQLLVLMLNSAPSGHLILTTHSPYTLTVINNLIYAAKVGVDHPEQVNRVIPKELWLSSEKVSAYMLEQGYGSDIIDSEIGEIKAELIDNASNLINQQYDEILQLDNSNGSEN